MQNLNNQPLTEVEIIIKKIESGELTNTEYFEEIARSEASCAAKQVVPQTFIGAGIFGLGFLMQLSTFQLGGLALFAGWMVWSKVRRATRGQADINAGNVEEYLPPEDVEYYRLAKAYEEDKKLESAAAKRKAELEKSRSGAIAPMRPVVEPAEPATSPTHEKRADIAEPCDRPSQPQQQPQNRPAIEHESFLLDQPDSHDGLTAPPSGLPQLDLAELRHYPAILIFGAPGGGKTSLARAIAYDRVEHGHAIAALDPHGVQWAQFPLIGAGMDYSAVRAAIKSFHKEIDRRYKVASDRVKWMIKDGYSQAEIEEQAYDFPSFTVIAEEFTNWSANIISDEDENLAATFLKRSWSDTRKVRLHTLFVSHSNTLQGGLAGAGGLAALRDSACYQIELFSQSVGGKALPTMEALLYRPNKPPTRVSVSNVLEMQKTRTNATSPPPPSSAEPAEPVQENTVVQPSEPLNPNELVGEPTPNPDEPEPNPDEPTDEQLINSLASQQFSERDRAFLLHQQGLHPEKIIKRIWSVSKGGSPRYKSARNQLKEWGIWP